ncbi:hypothetical protein [Vibrio salinus]|uniref:hypothetical protein n=1 Tax=Vibrio salinus TaxID=2899784 RepID=UPI001E618BF7|nr:hypothetical protein [Vibrio salinus]MCE0493805.1 hypothetical protein [Vibrio salinus]
MQLNKNKTYILSISLIASTLYSIGGYSAYNDINIYFVVLASYLTFSFLVISLSSYNNNTKSKRLLTCIFSILLLLITLNFILPFEAWLLPGRLKYKMFNNRSGVLYAIVVMYIPYLLSEIKKGYTFYITAGFSAMVVLVSLGRNPSLIYFLLILSRIGFRNIFLIPLGITGAFIAIFIDNVRAVGLNYELVDRFLSLKYLEYFNHSGEATVFGRLYSVYIHHPSFQDISFFSYKTIISPVIGLIPDFLSPIESTPHLARLIGDLYNTTGGLPLAIEGLWYFGIIGIPTIYILTFLPIFIIIKIKIIGNDMKKALLLFLFINSLRIDSATIYGFFFNGMFIIFIHLAIENILRRISHEKSITHWNQYKFRFFWKSYTNPKIN